MIKHAEVQNAYLQGRQAAMVKLSQESLTPEELQSILQEETPNVPIPMPSETLGTSPNSTSSTGMYQRALAGLRSAGANQLGVLGDIGITGQGLTRGDKSLAAYDPRQLATRENLSRLGIFTGAGGGVYLGGLDPRTAAISSAGAIGGGVVGGNLGQAASAALREFGATNLGSNPGLATSIGGALGGLGGGLGAGYLA
jgi:hypothetical protein